MSKSDTQKLSIYTSLQIWWYAVCMCSYRFDNKLTQALEEAECEREQKDKAFQENTALGAEIYKLRCSQQVGWLPCWLCVDFYMNWLKDFCYFTVMSCNDVFVVTSVIVQMPKASNLKCTILKSLTTLKIILIWSLSPLLYSSKIQLSFLITHLTG